MDGDLALLERRIAVAPFFPQNGLTMKYTISSFGKQGGFHMNENSKKFNWKVIVAVAMVALLAFSLYQIAVLKDDISNLKSRNSTLSAQVQTLRDEIHSIYDNVDAKLKEQASLISGIDFSIGNPSDDMKSVELTLTVVPKLISDDMELSVTVDGKTASLIRNGNEFTGTIDVGLFVDYDQWPLLSIKSPEGTKTEYLKDIDISYLFTQHLPSLYADMAASSTMKNGKLQVDAGFSIETQPAYDHAPITFVSFTLIEEINGKEISKADITNDVRKSGDSYNTHYVRSFEISQGDELKVYVIAEDSLGYIHKTLTHFWFQSEDGATAEAVPSTEMIFDKDGNLLYGEKELWG